MGPRLTLLERFEEASFRFLTGRNLVYNTSWEDPAVDRRAMRLTSDSSVLAITSAGCNVLDYALEAPERVVAVDINPRQTALLELKIAAIRRLSYDDMFALFGLGGHAEFTALYRDALRNDLSPFAREYWDRRPHWFAAADGNFYTRGLTGMVMRCLQWRLHAQRTLAPLVYALFDQPDIETQRRFYLDKVRPRIWTPFVRWFLSTPMFTSLVGVPMAQRRLLEDGPRGMSASLRELIDELFCTVPANDNYFWGVYVFGHYHPNRCPRYLTPDGFARLKAGLVDRIEFYTSTVTEYLSRPGPQFTHAVLLDHMDWMSSYYPEALEQEWEALMRRLRPGAQVLFRSAHVAPPFLDTTMVGPERTPLRQRLGFRTDEAQELSRADRVHTYASFHIAIVPGAT
ncbi:MAG TPA: BtaA family protein [Magnetospirillaceae bacterium]|jgi:S-adenosylmethionine-diacylglycerol 3-amino-3-carboxypropyl transferase